MKQWIFYNMSHINSVCIYKDKILRFSITWIEISLPVKWFCQFRQIISSLCPANVLIFKMAQTVKYWNA